MPQSIKAIPYARVKDLTFTKPRASFHCFKSRSYHNYSDTIPLDELPKVEELPSAKRIHVSPSTSLVSSSPLSSVSPSLHYTSSFDAKMQFLSTISKYRPAICSLISLFSDEFVPDVTALEIPAPLSEMYSPDNEELTYPELLRVCEELHASISISENGVINIEKATRLQSKSVTWYIQRAGQITASLMKSVCSTDSANPSQALIRQICYPQSNQFATKATEWGSGHECAAREAYVKDMTESHVNFTCRESGLFINKSHAFLGASPDGCIECDCCGFGILEIKCPYLIRRDDPSAASCLEDGLLKRTHAYYYQIQTQLFVCDAKYADFQLCTFDELEVANYKVERVTFDSSFFNDCLEKAHYFFPIVHSSRIGWEMVYEKPCDSL